MVTSKKIIIDVTYDRINEIGTATTTTGEKITVSYDEYLTMRRWIRATGDYVMIETDYSGYTLEELLETAI